MYKEIEKTLNQKKIAYDPKVLTKACDFAGKAHDGQKRATGDPYIVHPLAVAHILADLGIEFHTIIAALLHDTVEDTSISLDEIEKQFGRDIRNLVNGVTKLSEIEFSRQYQLESLTERQEMEVENFRKFFLAIAEDLRVVLIKLADRLHNLETLSAKPIASQKRVAQETLEIYAPLADRLGIGQLKVDMEDLAFRYFMPDEYQKVRLLLSEKIEDRKKYVNLLKKSLYRLLTKNQINVIKIEGRAKHFYSIYKKLKKSDGDIDKIYDLMAIRIIVPEESDCYKVLGVIHQQYKPLIYRIKDYIAVPKPNGYKSLHTTVFGLDGKITEIQIRTAKMEEEAERGIAAHWYYSEKKGLRAALKRILMPAPEKELTWIKQLQEWQKEIKGPPDEFFQSLKIDFFKDRIFVFTPRGDVINLPDGATPIDFAYNIHSEIGHHCQGALVDDKLVSLDTPLTNGQVVEIITNKLQKPSRDWLKFAKTNLAKSRVKQWLARYAAEPITETEIKKEVPKPAEAPKILAKSPSQKFIIEVEGDYKIPTALAKCCQPQPGDPVKGYITLNQKITVHRADCSNLSRLKDQKRFVHVAWKEPC